MLATRFITVLATFFLFIRFGYGQQISFKGLPADTIQITSSSGHYHFDDAGTTTGTQDSYTIAFNKELGKYVTAYKRTQIKLTIHPEAEKNKLQNVRTGAFDANMALDSLFMALSVRYKKMSVDQLVVRS
jgi:hypothetical protein